MKPGSSGASPTPVEAALSGGVVSVVPSFVIRKLAGSRLDFVFGDEGAVAHLLDEQANRCRIGGSHIAQPADLAPGAGRDVLAQGFHALDPVLVIGSAQLLGRVDDLDAL